MPQKVTDLDFAAAWRSSISIEEVSRKTGLTIRQCYGRRISVEQRLNIVLDSWSQHTKRPKAHVTKIGSRISETVRGPVVVFSDIHAWPGDRSVGFDALIKLIKRLKPAMIVCNGDAFDGARISRHPPGGWAALPTVADELAAAQELLGEIESAAPDNAKLIFLAGNHDSRFTSRLAQMAPEYVGVNGMDITDHFPSWNFAWDLWLNNDTVIKHRIASGVHAAYNNTMKGGKTIITGHTHRLQSIQFGDYNGLRFGIECGTLSDFGPETDKFAYAENNPVNWSQGFMVLTFNESGKLLDPEPCRVTDGVAHFRGEVV